MASYKNISYGIVIFLLSQSTPVFTSEPKSTPTPLSAEDIECLMKENAEILLEAIKTSRKINKSALDPHDKAIILGIVALVERERRSIAAEIHQLKNDNP